jgi:hypothetical protein
VKLRQRSPKIQGVSGACARYKKENQDDNQQARQAHPSRTVVASAVPIEAASAKKQNQQDNQYQHKFSVSLLRIRAAQLLLQPAAENIAPPGQPTRSRQNAPTSQRTSRITTTPPIEMGRYITPSSGLDGRKRGAWSSGTRSKASGKTAIGLEQSRNSIPMSIPTYSHYTGGDATTTAIPVI